MKKRVISAKGFTILESLMSIMLASALLGMIGTMLLAYYSVKTHKAKLTFIFDTACLINEIHVSDWAFFSNVENIKSLLHPNPVWNTKNGICYYYLYYDEYLRPMKSPAEANFYFEIIYYPDPQTNPKVYLLYINALSTTYGQLPYFTDAELYPAVAINEEEFDG
jgi:hypothetical protein